MNGVPSNPVPCSACGRWSCPSSPPCAPPAAGEWRCTSTTNTPASSASPSWPAGACSRGASSPSGDVAEIRAASSGRARHGRRLPPARAPRQEPGRAAPPAPGQRARRARRRRRPASGSPPTGSSTTPRSRAATSPTSGGWRPGASSASGAGCGSWASTRSLIDEALGASGGGDGMRATSSTAPSPSCAAVARRSSRWTRPAGAPFRPFSAAASRRPSPTPLFVSGSKKSRRRAN